MRGGEGKHSFKKIANMEPIIKASAIVERKETNSARSNKTVQGRFTSRSLYDIVQVLDAANHKYGTEAHERLYDCACDNGRLQVPASCYVQSEAGMR